MHNRRHVNNQINGEHTMTITTKRIGSSLITTLSTLALVGVAAMLFTISGCDDGTGIYYNGQEIPQSGVDLYESFTGVDVQPGHYGNENGTGDNFWSSSTAAGNSADGCSYINVGGSFVTSGCGLTLEKERKIDQDEQEDDDLDDDEQEE